METEKIVGSIDALRAKLEAGFTEVLVNQATAKERVTNLINTVEKSDIVNKDQHEKFFDRIKEVEKGAAVMDQKINGFKDIPQRVGQVESRIAIMEKVDDPAAISSNSAKAAFIDLVKLLVPLAVAVLIALKFTGKM